MKKYNYLAILLVALAAFGCSKKIEECNALIAVSNEYQTKLTQHQTAGFTKEDLAKIGTAVKLAEEYNTKLTGMELTDEKLSGLRTSYAESVKKTAELMGQMSTDFAPVLKAKETQDATQKKIEASTKSIEEVCGKKEKNKKKRKKKNKECKAIDKKLSAVPTDFTDLEAAKAAVQEIKNVSIKTEDFKAAIDGVVKALEENIANVEKFVALEKKAQDLMKQLTELDTKNSGVVDEINKYCQSL